MSVEVLEAHGARIGWTEVAPDIGRRQASRALLAGLLHPGAVVRQSCQRCGSSDHGPLHVTGSGPVGVSISYAGDIAVVAVAAAPALGVDAEHDTPATAARASEALGRTATCRDWTRLEAVAKARGTGLRDDWASAPITEHDGGWASGDLEGFDLAVTANGTPLVISVALGQPPCPPGRAARAAAARAGRTARP